MAPFISSNATIILNPFAGLWSSARAVRELVQFWEERGWRVSVRPTAYTGHATELARTAAQTGHGLVVAAGGDGTLNEVVNGLVYTETALAPLPVGTANVFTRELGLSGRNMLRPDWLQATCKQLANGRVQTIDVGKSSSGRYWLLWMGAGVDGYMVDQIEPRTRLFKRLGKMGYAAKALGLLPKYAGVPAQITVDDVQVEGDLLWVEICNSRLFAGGELCLNPAGVLDDALFEVWFFQGREWPDILRHVVDIGLQTHLHSTHVKRLTGRRVTVTTARPVPSHIDGEPHGKTPLSCEVQPGAIRLLAPVSAPYTLFSKPGRWLSNRWMTKNNKRAINWLVG